MGSLTGSVTLRWTKNDESDLAGYKVYYGTTPGIYSQVIDVGLTTTPNTPFWTISGLTNGVLYYFALTPYDTNSNEGPFSDEVQMNIAINYNAVSIG